MIKEKYKGIAAIFAVNMIFGLNIPVTKALMAKWMTPVGYTFTRMMFGTVVFWTISLFAPKEKVARKDMLIILIGGLLGYVGTQFLFGQSLKYTSPVLYSLLMAMTPIVVLVLSAFFLKEVVPAKKAFGILLSISGAFLIILHSQGSGSASNNLLGILFSLLCVLCYSIFLILTREVSKRYHPITIVKWMFLVSAVAITPFSFSELPNQIVFTSNATIMSFLLLGFALLALTQVALLPVALRRLEASTASIFMNLQPIVASIVAIFVGQDIFTWDKPVSAFLVLAGVYIVTRQKKSIKLNTPEVKPIIIFDNNCY